MTTMNISLPDELKAFVDEQVAHDGYSTTSEYIRALIRDAQKEAAWHKLDKLIAAGLESGAPEEVNAEWFAERRRELERRLKARKTGA
jgi:antitoxin ParD1/3/4